MEQVKFKEAYAATLEQFQNFVQKECKIKRMGSMVVKLHSHAHTIFTSIQRILHANIPERHQKHAYILKLAR